MMNPFFLMKMAVIVFGSRIQEYGGLEIAKIKEKILDKPEIDQEIVVVQQEVFGKKLS